MAKAQFMKRGRVELCGMLNKIVISPVGSLSDSEWIHCQYLIEELYDEVSTYSHSGVDGICALAKGTSLHVLLAGEINSGVVDQVANKLNKQLVNALPKRFYVTTIGKEFFGPPGSDVG